MDRIDRQLVHCLQRDGRASFRRIAAVLGVSEQTVARRYRSLLAAGALRVLVQVSSWASGEQVWLARMVCRPDAIEALADAIAARDESGWVSLTAGGSELLCMLRTDPEDAARGEVLLNRLPRTGPVLSFTAYTALHLHVGGEAEWFAFDDPLSPAQLAELLGPDPGAPPAGVAVAVPAAIRPVGPDDVPLLDALSRDGRAATADLARATGWPASRVAGRLGELLGSGAVTTDCDVVPQLFGFHAVAYLFLTVAPGDLAATGRALSLHPETSFVAAITGAANLMAAVVCRDADALYQYVTGRVGALPAVRQVEIVPVLRRVKQQGTRVRNGRLDVTGPVSGVWGMPGRLRGNAPAVRAR